MKHQTISFIKSFFRLGGYALLYSNSFRAIAVLWLIVSELWGVLEEIGHE